MRAKRGPSFHLRVIAGQGQAEPAIPPFLWVKVGAAVILIAMAMLTLTIGITAVLQQALKLPL